MNLTRFIIRNRSSFWYIPSLYGSISVFLAFFSVRVDYYITTHNNFRTFIPNFLVTDIDLARTILSTISASLLTMTTITFSTILVVLTTFLSEFSPRTLQNFITDVKTQRVLGVFVGGFIYSILLLLFLRENSHNSYTVPSIAVLLAIICLIVFVFFINHVSSWMQVSNLIHNITMIIMEKIDRELKDSEKVHEDAPWEDWESEELTHLIPRHINLDHSGYIKHIDIYGLVKQATKDDCIVKVERKLSEYVDQDTPVFSVWKLSKDVNDSVYSKFITVGKEKAPVDDIEFGLAKIVEIALRALSPGINDPNTAINCIDNLGKILTKLGKKYLPRTYHNDKNRNLRVIIDQPTYNDYLLKCFYQIRQSGFQDTSVLVAGLKALTLIASNNSKKIKEHVWAFSVHIVEGIDQDSLLTLDKKYVNQHLERLAKATDHIKDLKNYIIS